MLHWNAVFYHYNKWSKADCWRTIWITILTKNRQFLAMSSVELDGSHTPAKNGGDAVGYQGRKACNTTNALFLSDNQGRADFYGLCKRGRIIFVIFLAPFDDCVNPMDQPHGRPRCYEPRSRP